VALPVSAPCVYARARVRAVVNHRMRVWHGGSGGRPTRGKRGTGSNGWAHGRVGVRSWPVPPCPTPPRQPATPRELCPHVKLAGPTSFAPAIRQASGGLPHGPRGARPPAATAMTAAPPQPCLPSSPAAAVLCRYVLSPRATATAAAEPLAVACARAAAGMPGGGGQRRAVPHPAAHRGRTGACSAHAHAHAHACTHRLGTRTQRQPTASRHPSPPSNASPHASAPTTFSRAPPLLHLSSLPLFSRLHLHAFAPSAVRCGFASEPPRLLLASSFSTSAGVPLVRPAARHVVGAGEGHH
jgi:hypothetical protein